MNSRLSTFPRKRESTQNNELWEVPCKWVQDCRNASYHGAPRDGSAWERGDCSQRVLRGGSWFKGPRNLRSANRNGVPSGYRLNSFGFRIARTLAP